MVFYQNPKDELSEENDKACYGRVAPSQCIRWKAKAKAEIDNLTFTQANFSEIDTNASHILLMCSRSLNNGIKYFKHQSVNTDVQKQC